jgi:transcriptional regulator with XRE-family HTH domain
MASMTCGVMAAGARLAIVPSMPRADASPPLRAAPVGVLLRDWRQRRRWSQLELAGIADVSPRHLSCLETGRAEPSREMVLRLADRLDVPLRERNRLLAAAGYAPLFAERAFDDDALAPARRAIGLVLRAIEPWPALAVDRHWNLVAHNATVPRLLDGVAPHLLAPPLNVLRASLHPEGLAPRIANLGEWRAHLLARLERQTAQTRDAVLADLLDELRALPGPPAPPHATADALLVPLVLDTPGGRFAFVSTTTVFGAPNDVQLSEVALETLLPADAATQGAFLRAMGERAAEGAGAA